jgi:hypothetical protein
VILLGAMVTGAMVWVWPLVAHAAEKVAQARQDPPALGMVSEWVSHPLVAVGLSVFGVAYLSMFATDVVKRLLLPASWKTEASKDRRRSVLQLLAIVLGGVIGWAFPLVPSFGAEQLGVSPDEVRASIGLVAGALAAGQRDLLVSIARSVRRIVSTGQRKVEAAAGVDGEQ